MVDAIGEIIGIYADNDFEIVRIRLSGLDRKKFKLGTVKITEEIG